MIEEGSDDVENSFASDTPHGISRKRRAQEAYEEFQQPYTNPEFKSSHAEPNRLRKDAEDQRAIQNRGSSPNGLNVEAQDELDHRSFATKQTQNDNMFMVNSLSNKQIPHLRDPADSFNNSKISIGNRESSDTRIKAIEDLSGIKQSPL